MHIVDLQVPYFGDFYIEVGGLTRGRTYCDWSVNRSGVEVWCGSVHAIIDLPATRLPAPVRTAFLALVILAAVVTPPEMIGLPPWPDMMASAPSVLDSTTWGDGDPAVPSDDTIQCQK